MIFVDTGAWFSAFVPNDPHHAKALDWLQQNEQPLITTDYVLDELLSLMKVRGEFQRSLSLVRRFLSEPLLARLHFITPDEFNAAVEVFRRFQDQQWSFTDCVSYALIKRFGINTAFAIDHHFRQFGTVTVVPDLSLKKSRRPR